MSNRIDTVLRRTREEGRAALIVFVTAGDPDLKTTAELIPALADAGADLIELGVPHSDPIAEGPTIQAATTRALRHSMNLTGILEVVREAREVTDVPIALMGYLNNVLAFGEERLVEECAASGVDGLIVVDVPFEAGDRLQTACDAHDVHRILLVAPTSTPDRVVKIASRTRGFVYCVSVTGVTGARSELPSDLELLVERIQRVTDTPVAVGFGISTPDHAARVARVADGVIVGSALVQRIGDAATPDAAVAEASQFVRELAAAVRGARP